MSDRSPQKPVLLYGLLAASLALNVYLMFGGGPSAQPGGETDVESADLDSEAGGEPVEEAPAEAVAKPAAPEPAAAAPAGDWTVVRANVEQSLARTLQINAGEDGDALSSVYTRLFVWDLDLRRDMQKGDALAVVWRKAADGLPEIAAANLKSMKLGKTVTAWRWQAPGDAFPSYWHPDGSEAPLRLKNGPIEAYDQITSLLKDRPTHKGMDFKTPVGTEVKSPKAGTVLRVNWNWGANGNCIEVRLEDGVLAKFLHLSENRVKEGDRVSAGQVIALSGNTGHSTAPHLHYQLDRDNKTIDPLDYHGTVRRTLTPEQTAALKRDTASFETMLAGGGQ